MYTNGDQVVYQQAAERYKNSIVVNLSMREP
jgi:hypothetical protein